MVGSSRAWKEHERNVANGLVHKVRNSLNVMRAHLALLQKFTTACEEPRVPQHIDKLEQAILRLEEVLKEYIDFASPARDKCSETDLPELVQEVLEFVALDLEQGQVTVVEEYAPDLPKVFSDRDKLKRAILNLVINARQAMAAGGRLTIRANATPRGRIVLEISDTGPGIPDDDQAQLFQPFFSNKPEGLGLGLAITKRIIEGFRGRIEYDSQIGAGTTFRILLPSAARQQAFLERQGRRKEWLQPAS